MSRSNVRLSSVAMLNINALRHAPHAGARRRTAIVVACMAMLMMTACEKAAPPPPPPPVVEVMNVIQRDVPIHNEWIGALDGDVNATIRPQVTGYLVRQNYREGDAVRKGQVLFEIDPSTFKAAVDQAQAVQAKQKAIHDTAVANLARIKPLAEKNAVSQRDLDDALGQEASSRAALDQATAALETARLNLGFTRITSPIDGIAGIAKAQIGDLLSPSATAELTTVSRVDPIKVYVNISEREYIRWLERKAEGRQPECDSAGTDPRRWIGPSDSPADSRCSTGRSTRPPERSRSARFSPIQNRRCVPASSPRCAPRPTWPRAHCWCRNAPSRRFRASTWWRWWAKATRWTQRPVRVGDRVGSEWIISEGLKPGEKIIVEGTQKVRPGVVVAPQPFVPASAPGAQQSAQAGKEGVRRMSKFFINRPIVAMVISILMTHRRHRRHVGFAHGAVPQHRPARNQGHGHLHRRGRADRRAGGGHADRAADVRRGQHELHVLDQRQQRRVDADRQLRRRDRRQHRPAAGPDARGSGRVPAAVRCAQLRRHGGQVDLVAAGHVRALFAERAPTTTCSWPTTPTSTSTTR
jgi:membrane fusion protein (multidrug efflux system)